MQGPSFVHRAKTVGVLGEPFLLYNSDHPLHFCHQLGLYSVPIVNRYEESLSCTLIAAIHTAGLLSVSPEARTLLPEKVFACIPQFSTSSSLEFQIVIADATELLKRYAEGGICRLNLALHAWLPLAVSRVNQRHAMGIFTESSGSVSMSNDEAVAINSFRPESVYVHPAGEGSLAISPDNARFNVAKNSPDRVVDFFFAAQEHASALRANAFLAKDLPPLRSVICYYWLVTDNALADRLRSLFFAASSLTEADTAMGGIELSPRLRTKWSQVVAVCNTFNAK